MSSICPVGWSHLTVIIKRTIVLSCELRYQNDIFMFGRVIMMIGSILLAHVASATSLTWDANTSDAVATDGSGTWNASNTNWWNGAADTNWTSSNPDAATFGATNGAAGIVT